MDKLTSSPNFREGIFQNLAPTPMMAEGVSTFAVLRDFLHKPKLVTPPAPLPSVKTNLTTLQANTPLVVWFGHSSYLIHINGINILVDPVFSGSASPVAMFIKAFAGTNQYGPRDMPAIDYMVLTHNHYDHLDKKTLIALAGRTQKYIVPLGVEKHLVDWKINPAQITTLDWWQSKELSADMQITSTPARHFSGRGLKRGGTLWTSYLFNLFGFTIFIGGDSGYGDHFSTIAKQAGVIDLAILECGQYNEAWPYIHMLPEQVVQAHIDLGAKTLLPVHWGKFALAYHHWDDPIKRVTAKAATEGIHITTPMIGEPVIIHEKYPDQPWWNTVH
ncbi:MBL fold metallo-hydrolase [Flavihumibacter fluvii]|uniref:MBL fold metallo-hydrolase n=1 Tax=Flavihumibacter fluvii TaxID=2838157 RepID=UPI001BDEBC4F|nr:MBL fold metallo-hydrolase [Flavihumibacter fluvii]ULQ54349.1 MBL fold metallo-hydrolase [Flavihumibacter fluvii]